MVSCHARWRRARGLWMMSDLTRSGLHELMVRTSIDLLFILSQYLTIHPSRNNKLFRSQSGHHNNPQRLDVSPRRCQSCRIKIRREPARDSQHRSPTDAHLPLRPPLRCPRRGERGPRPETCPAPRQSLHRRQPRNQWRGHPSTCSHSIPFPPSLLISRTDKKNKNNSHWTSCLHTSPTAACASIQQSQKFGFQKRF